MTETTHEHSEPGQPAGLGCNEVLGGVQQIHILWGGPERWISCAGKQWVFEDHPYCGPVVLTPKTRDPSENQPAESSPFWQHVNAWYAQGKRTKEVDGKAWCVYETQMQEARRRGRAAQRSSSAVTRSGIGCNALLDRDLEETWQRK